MLKIYVTSFSYRSGIPEDPSGNGGGYVFDCRAIHNPGRYDEYKMLNGRDKEVIKFFEERSEADKFLHDVWKVVYRTAKEYQRRGYDHLMVSFGCTGGQHRSVYCAERTANYLRTKPDIEVEIEHVELERHEDL